MIDKKLLSGKRVNYKKLNYAHFFNGINVDYDENILPITYSVNTYNFSFNSGALKTGLGIDYLKLPTSYSSFDNSTRIVNFDGEHQFKAGWLYKKDNANIIGMQGVNYDNYLILQDINGDFYIYDICSTTNFLSKIEGLNLTDIPTILNYNLNSEDVVLICSGQGMWTYSFNKHTATKIETAPKFKSMCLHYERLFTTVVDDRYAVWFSDDLDPTNWNISLNEAGFIRFDSEHGIVNKVVSFNDYVYVFREYGISRITAYANQTEFNVNHLFVSSGKIYGDTVTVCGDRIMFLTENGLYSFDGYSTNKINLNIDNMLASVNNCFVASAYCNGKYYLACRLNFNDDKKIICEENNYYNNAVLEFDLNSKTLNILRGADVRCLLAIKDDKVNKVVAFYYDDNSYKLGEICNCGKLINKVLPKCWCSPFSSVGYPEKSKVIKSIYLNATAPLTITINTEKLTKQFYLVPKNNLIKLNTIIKCDMFAINFESNEPEIKISSPTVIIGVT